LKDCLQRLPAFDLKLVAALQDDARPLKAILHELHASSCMPSQSASIAIGPEGDFSPLEYESLRNAGFLPMSLGSIILRVETATMFSLSILSHELRAENDAKNNA
jgi:16S rRNA (uracil1498-N3)-methyltransferase